ncbi:hypothetical protein ONS96_012712 [Cadophora gregata f. sp. sojae]|nr:hypothetical protein ONS96_012712 [Cadophora gregata f. sp. sojae]
MYFALLPLLAESRRKLLVTDSSCHSNSGLNDTVAEALDALHCTALHSAAQVSVVGRPVSQDHDGRLRAAGLSDGINGENEAHALQRAQVWYVRRVDSVAKWGGCGGANGLVHSKERASAAFELL